MMVRADTFCHHDRIIEKLSKLGVPEENRNPSGLVSYAKENENQLAELVYAVLPTEEESVLAVIDGCIEEVFRNSIVWLRWLMFGGDPGEALQYLAKVSSNRGVCGAVWGNNDIAFRCRTCEHDPTCAICVPCFQNGNHKDHDYSIIYTGGGCCDCGDITAWKREGFCSKHRGAEEIQPLPAEFAKTLGPVMDSLLKYWMNNLLYTASSFEKHGDIADKANVRLIADGLASTVVEMLLEFCKCSESLLSFISGRVHTTAGLLNVLLKAERFLADKVVKKLHELLLKLLGEPIFKYEFAKAFLSYYPTVVNEAVRECKDSIFKKYPLLTTFSVQIFTVQTLTPRLVEEMNLLAVLFESLENIFVSCSGDDGRLQVAKWANLYETTLRVLEDIRFVMSHSAVPKYLTHDRRDLVRTWTRLLAFVQGMNPQKREIATLIEDENDNTHLPFVLGHSLANIHSLLVPGVFSGGSGGQTDEEASFGACRQDVEDQDILRHAKVGRLSQESSVSSITGKGPWDHASKAADSKSDNLPVPSSALWLIFECLRGIENWLGIDSGLGPSKVLSPKLGNGSASNFFGLKRTLTTFKRGNIFKSYTGLSSSGKSKSSYEARSKQPTSPSYGDYGRPNEPEAVLSGSDENILEGDSTFELEGLRLLSLSDWPDIVYDVSSQEISVHVPLHRLLSMVLQRALRECYGESVLPNMTNAALLDTSSAKYGDFLGHILGGCHPFGFSAFLMEHPLRIRVFCAEVHAGMWRRNGDAAILSYEWYRSVRWSEQGLELDLFLLQCCGALAPADLYVKRILDRFGLSDYLSLNLEQSSEYEAVLMQEMLTLLIQIVKERRFCGLTSAKCLQKELVYKLSIGDATRSQLVKSLPRDLSKIDKLQEVLDTVAEYSNPSGMTQGMYKLRPSHWKELDLYHPRWNSRDLQAAEERYFRFCNVSALTTQLPKWNKIYSPLQGVAQVATCRTVLQIVRAVLFYAVFSDKVTPSRAPDGVLLTALHLLALALDICQVQRDTGDLSCYAGDIIPILAFAGEEICINRFGNNSILSLLVLLMRMDEKESANSLMEAGNLRLSTFIGDLLKKFAVLRPECGTQLLKLAPELCNQLSRPMRNGDANGSHTADSEKRKAKARERQAAILEKMRAQQFKFLASICSDVTKDMDNTQSGQEESCADVVNDSQDSAEVVCSLCHDTNSRRPLSYLVLLQKSRLLSFVDRDLPSWEQDNNLSGKEHVIKSTAKTYDLSKKSSMTSGSGMTSSSHFLGSIQNSLKDFASIGQPGEVDAFLEFIRARFPFVKDVQHPCLSTEASERSTSSLEALEQHMYLLILGGVHASFYNSRSLNDGENLLTTERRLRSSSDAESLLLGKYIAALSKETSDNPSASENAHFQGDKAQSESNSSSEFGPSGCDGIYISSCGHAVHQRCLDRYLSSLRGRYVRGIVFEGGHIVDPDQGEFLCPVCRGLANSVLPAMPAESTKVRQPLVISTDARGSLSSSNRQLGSLCLQDALSLLRIAADVARSDDVLKRFPVHTSVKMSQDLEPIFRVLWGMYFPSKDKTSGCGRVSHPMILWDMLKYSIMSTEIAARSRKNSLSPNYSVDVIYKELNSSGGFILSLLLNVIQSTRTKNSSSALARLRGIQLFAKSICSGTSPSDFSKQTFTQGGNILYMLENAEAEVQYPDIMLWRCASQPILARDAFSSLMWIFFCLPCPFLSCKESYFALVHAFYVVTIVQAVIAYSRKQQYNVTELGCHDCLISDIYRAMGEYGKALDYFDSNYVNLAYGIKDAVRSLSFPYLRRCALLWRLINHLSSLPFRDDAAIFDGSSDSTDHMMGNADMEELFEIRKLEKMFSIPSLDVIINDETSRSMALIWLRHFTEEFKVHKHQDILRCNPAAPFKLMTLPHLYQDLLQRYIKRRCPDCDTVNEELVLCLLCGKRCSPSWKPCCRESGCQTHAMACGAGIGVFLLIRRTTILLQRSARQASWPSAYLDAFGEEDNEMIRGKPLFLNEERYAALTHMVASHGLDRSSKVLRQTTLGSFFMF